MLALVSRLVKLSLRLYNCHCNDSFATCLTSNYKGYTIKEQYFFSTVFKLNLTTMNHPARTIFQDEIVKLQAFVLELAHKVQANGELMLEFLQEKNKMSEVFLKIKEKDKEIDKARWQVHDYGDELIVRQQPVANDFRQIIASIQTTDNLERIGDHFK